MVRQACVTLESFICEAKTKTIWRRNLEREEVKKLAVRILQILCNAFVLEPYLCDRIIDWKLEILNKSWKVGNLVEVTKLILIQRNSKLNEKEMIAVISKNSSVYRWNSFLKSFFEEEEILLQRRECCSEVQQESFRSSNDDIADSAL